MAGVQPVRPFGHYALRLYASRMPEGDQKVFADPDMEAMFLDDVADARRRRFGAVVHDVALFGRPWGFELGDIGVPVFWWHGDADNVVPLAHAEHSVALLHVRALGSPTESHLGGFAAADVVLDVRRRLGRRGRGHFTRTLTRSSARPAGYSTEAVSPDRSRGFVG